MAVLRASNNGGHMNTVHNQTNDGSVFSVVIDGEYVPISFTWVDYLGECQTHLLASGRFYHKELMRGDCGWEREDDSVQTLFSWQQMETNIDGFSGSPSGEFGVITSQTCNKADCVGIDGLEGHRSVYKRRDREYWTPGKTLAPTTEEELFGFEQWNPISCPPDPQDDCGNYILKGDKTGC